MGLNIISVVEETENAAAKLISDAAANAVTLVDNAKTNGKVSVENARKKAQAEAAEYSKVQDAAAEEEMIGIAKETEDKKAALGAAAAGRIEAAAALIKERIVKG